MDIERSPNRSRSNKPVTKKTIAGLLAALVAAGGGIIAFQILDKPPAESAAPKPVEKPGPQVHERFGDLILTCHMTSERLAEPGAEGLKQLVLAHNPKDDRTVFLGMFAMTEDYNGWVHNFSGPNELAKGDRAFVAEDCTSRNEPILAEMPGTL